jgi:hypothetical protein
MALKTRDFLIVAAATILIIAAIIFAVVLPALELQQVRRELETPPAVPPPEAGTQVPSSTGTLPAILPTEAVSQVPTSTETQRIFLPTEAISQVPTSTETPVIQGPPSFLLLVVPVEARAPPGGTVLYTMTVEPRGGFDDPIDLRLDVSALLLYHESFDLGTVYPPYPKTFDYRFVVPATVPSGITVSGLLSAEGGGYQDTVDLVLLIS